MLLTSPGEKETFDWARAGTEPDALFLREGSAENLVYFGRRTILLPVLGSEWIPSPEYGNGQQRNRFIKSQIYACRQIECLSSAFTKYDVAPDYMIYEVSDDAEQEWIEELSGSLVFEVAFASEAMVTLRRR